MEEIADLLRELVQEVRELRVEISTLTAVEPHAAGYNLKDLIDTIGGPLGYSLVDVVDAIRDLDLNGT